MSKNFNVCQIYLDDHDKIYIMTYTVWVILNLRYYLNGETGVLLEKGKKYLGISKTVSFWEKVLIGPTEFIKIFIT